MEEQEFRSMIQQYARQVRMEQDEATLTAVLKLIIIENPEMKSQVRSSVAIVKEEIEKVNSMSDDELDTFSEEEIGGVDESSEYEMLEKLFVKKLEEDDLLSAQTKALIIYGSYAKRLHVVGESDINFVVVLNSSSDEAIKKINQIAEEIVTPEVAHIFDLMILKIEDLNQLEKFGPVFTFIHALYAKDGEVKLGENVFSTMEITNKQIMESANIIIHETIGQMDEIIRTAKDEKLPDDELDYLIGASIIDIAFALCCHKVGVDAIKLDLVKPDIHEEIREIWGEKSEFSEFYTMLEQAHAFKLGIRLKNSQDFLQRSFDFIKKVVDYTKLQEIKT
ncbi:MAG: hypothetical protein ACFE9L_02505 [Candidatus Hodarchaeota archaeon]